MEKISDEELEELRNLKANYIKIYEIFIKGGCPHDLYLDDCECSGTDCIDCWDKALKEGEEQ